MPVLELNVNVTLLIMLINIGFAFIIVFLERRNPTATWTWLFVLMFMPIVGFFLYLFIGQDMGKKLFAKKGRSRSKEHSRTTDCSNKE